MSMMMEVQKVFSVSISLVFIFILAVLLISLYKSIRILGMLLFSWIQVLKDIFVFAVGACAGGLGFLVCGIY